MFDKNSIVKFASDKAKVNTSFILFEKGIIFDFAKKILFSDEPYKPPIIVLGRNVSDEEINEYHKISVEFAFRKPVNLNAFKLAIEKSLQRETPN